MKVGVWLLSGAWILVFGVLIALGSEPRGPSPFFPPHSTVVLLSGLPGDVESEDNYRDQMQSWIEVVQSSGNAEKIFALADAPETLALPTNSVSALESGKVGESASGKVGASSPTDRLTHSPTYSPVTLLHADRTNFLALGQSFAGTTNPLVVIAWGHGGRQGRNPVFHVRGARLTPSDFKALAARAPEAESCWVLVFRGSGAFARELAGAHRQILSSERDTLFASDPVGMGLLVKIVRADPAVSFRTLAEQLGRATTAWYNERHLARTEEPTLWLGDGQPQNLAAPSQDNAFASVPAQEAGEAAPEEKPKPSPERNDLPAVWKEISLVEPKKYPDADGVVLRRRLAYTLGSNPAVASEQEEFIQILTSDGKRYGDFDISYTPPFEDINFLDCEVLPPQPPGQNDARPKLVRLDPDAIREGREESIGDYHGGQRKFFSLPGVVPGAILHVRFRRQWKEFPLPHVSLEIPIDQELPVLDSTVEISLPKETPFHFAFEGLEAEGRGSEGEGLDPILKQTSYGVTYAWHFENLQAQVHEPLAPPRQEPRLLISTFADWPAFAEWYGRISKLTDEVTPEIAAKAAELTRQAQSAQEKVAALYNYVTRLRYVAVPLGVNSFRPHAAANVLKNQYGDCKDKANLLNALLHAVNIEAHLVLVPRFSQAHEGLPGLAFNHAISQISLDRHTLWADTTDEVCRFGLLPPGDPGRNVLVIDGQTIALTRLPAPDPKDHLLTVRGEIDCARLADALPATLRADAVGFPDYALRAVAHEATEHGASFPLLAARFRPAAGSFALEKQTATKAAALDENFSWHAEGGWVGISSLSPSAPIQPNTPTLQHSNTPLFLVLRPPFWLPKEWDMALHRRLRPLFLNEGYPLTLDEEIAYALPASSQPAIMPEVAENPKPPLRWKIEWVNTPEGKLLARFRAELAAGELNTSETRLFQRQLSQMMSALAAGGEIRLP